MPKVLITDDVSPILVEGLEQRNYRCDYIANIDQSSVLEIIQGYEGLIINSKINCNKELLDKASHLKWIGRLGSGMEVIDTQLCDVKGIRYFNSPDGNAQAVAEHTLGLLLALMRNIPKANQEVKNGLWIREANRGVELKGKTIGIIGFGHTGSAFAQLLTSFGVKILAYDKYKTNFSTDVILETSLQEIFEEADIVSLHLPLTPETMHYGNVQFFNNFKRYILLVNTSRGKVLNTSDFIIKMKEGKILGAALDVLENERIQTLNEQEKIQFKELVSFSNIVISPHIAGWTKESKVKIADSLLRSIDEIRAL